MNDEKRIRKLYGEKMWHLCRDLFPTILDNPGLLCKLLEEHFHPSRFLYTDIKDHHLEEDFKDYIYSFVDVEKKRRAKTYDSVEELFEQAGYDFYECHNQAELQSFRKYYKEDEELCSFHYGNRLDRCYVFFAVKKDVDNIKRENFTNPKREDEYGTSVISLQFSKGKKNHLSIKNRYNHHVNNPDATFHNNLENISKGLTNAFEKEYNFKITKDKDSMFELDEFNYVYANDGKWYKFNQEINNIYYCPDNIIIDNYQVKEYPKEKYLIFEYFILDLVNHQIKTYDELSKDTFPKLTQNIKHIDIKNNDYKGKIVRLELEKGFIEIVLDRKNQIISYKDNVSEYVGEHFLEVCQNIKHLELLEATEIQEYFMEHGNSVKLKELIIPKVTRMEDFCFVYSKLAKWDISSLKYVGYRSLDLSIIKMNIDKLHDDFGYVGRMK